MASPSLKSLPSTLAEHNELGDARRARLERFSTGAGNKFRRRQVQVAIVGDQLEISIGEQLIRRHKIKHDRTREHGALANPGGRPRRINAA